MDLKEFVLCLLVCFGLSFLIGIERQYRRRIIGLRTIILVSLGSFLFVSMSFFVGDTDVTRIAAQVVSGIGFLGAGVIIKNGFKVSGLTTAATLWCCAAIGVLCASGALFQAILGTLVILFANIVLRYINRLVNNFSYNLHAVLEYEIDIKMEEDLGLEVKKFINNYIDENKNINLELSRFSINNSKNNHNLKIELSVKKTNHEYIDNLINELYQNFKISNISVKKRESNGDDEEEL